MLKVSLHYQNLKVRSVDALSTLISYCRKKINLIIWLNIRYTF